MSQSDIRVYVGGELVARCEVSQPEEITYSYGEFARSGGTLENHTSQKVAEITVTKPEHWSDLSDHMLTKFKIKNGRVESFEPILDCLQNLPITRQYTEHGEWITEFAEVRIESPFGNHKVVPNARVKLAYWPK